MSVYIIYYLPEAPQDFESWKKITLLTRARAEAILRCEVLRSEFTHYSSNAKKKRERVHCRKKESEFTTGNLARVNFRTFKVSVNLAQSAT